MSLSGLLNDTSILLNDQNYTFTSQTQLTRWVNEARKNCAKRTGCVRRFISGRSAFGASAQPGYAIPGVTQPGSLPNATPQVQGLGAAQNSLMTIPNVERYPYVGFFNPYLRQAYAGCDQIIDVISLAVNWGGGVRPVLDWMPWDNFQAYCRAYAFLNTSFPSVWSVYNDGTQGEVWLFPVPSQAGEIEADASVTPKSVYSDSDYDVIPDGFQESLKFGAASLALLSSQRYAQAQVMENIFADQIGVARVAVDKGKTATYYWSVP